MPCISDFPEPYFIPAKRSNLPVIESSNGPLPGQTVVGYMIYEAPQSFLTRPKPAKLNFVGWVSCTVLAFICWPLTCVPCCISCCYDSYQVPVYDKVPEQYQTEGFIFSELSTKSI